MEEEKEETAEGCKLCGGCQRPEAGHQGTAQPRVPATAAPSAPVGDSLSLLIVVFSYHIVVKYTSREVFTLLNDGTWGSMLGYPPRNEPHPSPSPC